MQKTDEYSLEQHFKFLATRLRARAFSERSGVARAELQRLADCYVDLAESDSPRNFFGKKEGK